MTAAMSRLAEPAADAAIAAATKTLQLPTIRAQVSAYDLTCRLKYNLTCRSRHCDHGMGSPPATRVSRSLRR
jgi:hypothetical protein